MIDITLRLDENNQIWKRLEAHENKLMSAGHVGTHTDVYKKSIIPLEYFKTKGVLIDCVHYGLDKEIEIEALNDIKIEEGNFVIFKTDMQMTHPYGGDIYFEQNPQLSWDLINYLLEKKVYFIGIDCAGIRRGKEHIQADIKAEENGTYIIENLDLSKLGSTLQQKFDVYTMWVENPFNTGIPTRVLIDPMKAR